MDIKALEVQRTIAAQKLEALKQEEKELRPVSIVFQYLSSLVQPEKFTETQKEDLRRLALEIGFTESITFDDWYSIDHPKT